MSVTVDYFFNYEGSVVDLLAGIGQAVGSELKPYNQNNAEPVYFARFLSMELSLLTDHTLENDDEFNFGDFQYEIGIRNPWRAAGLRDMQIPVVALIASLLHRRSQVKGGILVYDVQILLARYEERPNTEFGNQLGLDITTWLFDTISNEFVVFPEHFKDLNDRLINQ